MTEERKAWEPELDPAAVARMKDIAAAERAVIEAAVHWFDGTTTEELRPALRELLRLRAAAKGGEG